MVMVDKGNSHVFFTRHPRHGHGEQGQWSHVFHSSSAMVMVDKGVTCFSLVILMVKVVMVDKGNSHVFFTHPQPWSW